MIEFGFHRYQDIFGAQLEGFDVDDMVDALFGIEDRIDLFNEFGIGAFAQEQGTGLIAHETGHHAEDESDDNRSDAVEDQYTGDMLEEDEQQGNGKTGYCGKVFEEDDDEFGFFRFSQVGENAGIAAFAVDFPGGFIESGPFGGDGEDENAEGVGNVFYGHGVCEFMDAFVDGESGAGGKEDDGDDEGPEIEFAGKTERVEAVGFAFAPFDSDEQQYLVQGIGGRVDGFGDHGGGMGNNGDDEFEQGDKYVCQQCGNDD